MSSLFEEGLLLAQRQARMTLDVNSAGVGAYSDIDQDIGPFEELSLSNAVPGSVGLPAYFTMSGNGTVPLPTDSPIAFFVSVAFGIALAGLPGWLLAPKLGYVKGHLVGAAVSGGLITGLWYWQKKRSATETKKPGDAP